jgi:hypothetical protein
MAVPSTNFRSVYSVEKRLHTLRAGVVGVGQSADLISRCTDEIGGVRVIVGLGVPGSR